MTENEFDKFFKDRVGDEEQSFEFRQDDWLAAAHEMDKVLPVAADTVVSPVRFLTWHKWAAAAAVVFLASQVWLIAKIVDLKEEVVSLKQENSTLADPKNTGAADQRLETIVLFDTIYKPVIIERSVYKNVPLNDRSMPSQLANNNDVAKNKLLPTNPSNITSADDKNFTPIVNKEKTQKENRLDKDKTVVTAESDNTNIANNTTLSSETADSLNRLQSPTQLLLVKDVFAALPNVTSKGVKSNRMRSSYLDLKEFDLGKTHIIQPAPLFLNGWALGVNSLLIKLPTKNQQTKIVQGANVRLTYDLRSNWRLSADVDFWSENRVKQDTSHQPHIKPPSPDYRLTTVNLKTKNVEIRLGADYAWTNKSPITPFVGFGLSYNLQTQNNIEFEFKKPGKPNYPIAIRNEDPDINKPVFLSLRAGAMGKIYRRLGWSVNLGKELPFNGKTNQLLSGQIGLSYSL